MAQVQEQLPTDVKSVFEQARLLAADNARLRMELEAKDAECRKFQEEHDRDVAQQQVLNRRVQTLQNENLALLAEVDALTRQIADATDKDHQLVLELELKKVGLDLAARNREMFGPSRSERRGRREEPKEGEGAIAAKEAKKTRKGGKRTEQPALPIREIRHKLDENDQVCPCCGGGLMEWEGKTENSDEIGIQRIVYEVRRHKKQKYRCSDCSHVETALGPEKLAPKSRYSIDFAVDISVERHGAHVPFPRQVARMKAAGLNITTQTLWDVQHMLYILLLPAFLALHQYLLAKHDVLGADETSWRMMLKGATLRWWAWILTAVDGVVILLSPTRGQAGAQRLLGAFSKVLMADGYAVYAALERSRDRHGVQPDLQGELSPADILPRPNYDLAGCWDHARRPLYHAEAVAPEAGTALDIIARLYAVEAEATRRAALGEDLLEVRRTLRDQRSRAIVAELKVWMDAQTPLPGMKLDEAIGYLRNQWPHLLRFLDNPAIPISNAHSEQRARAVVLNRNNSVGSRSEVGARVTELNLSLIGTCQILGIDPRAYMREAASRNARDRSNVLLPHEYAAELALTAAEAALAAANQAAAAEVAQVQAMVADPSAPAYVKAVFEERLATVEDRRAAARAAVAHAQERLATCQAERAEAVVRSKEHAKVAEAAAEAAKKIAAAKEAVMAAKAARLGSAGAQGSPAPKATRKSDRSMSAAGGRGDAAERAAARAAAQLESAPATSEATPTG